MKRLFLVGVLTIVNCAVGSGQEPQKSGAISGVVTDTQGAAIAGASVVVHDQQSENAQSVRTDSNGRFHVGDLPTGKYSVTVRFPCFETSSQTDIPVSPGSGTALKFALPLCGATHIYSQSKNFSTRIDRRAKTELEEELIDKAEQLPCKEDEKGSARSKWWPGPTCASKKAMEYYFGLVRKNENGHLPEAGEGPVTAGAYYGASVEFDDSHKLWVVKLRLEYSVTCGMLCGLGEFRSRWVFFDKDKNVTRVDDDPECDCGWVS